MDGNGPARNWNRKAWPVDGGCTGGARRLDGTKGHAGRRRGRGFCGLQSRRRMDCDRKAPAFSPQALTLPEREVAGAGIGDLAARRAVVSPKSVRWHRAWQRARSEEHTSELQSL